MSDPKKQISATNALQIPEWIVKLASANKTPPATILKEFNEQKVKMVEDQAKGDIPTLAKYAIMGKYRKAPVPKVVVTKTAKYREATIIGFKIGDLGMGDSAQKMREWAQFTVDNKSLEDARKLGLVTVQEGKVLVLDSRDQVFGRNNTKKGTPLDPKLKLRYRTLIMLAKEQDDAAFIWTRLQTNDNTLAPAWGQLPFNTLVTAPVKIGRKDQAGILATSIDKGPSQTIFRQLKEKLDYFGTFEKAMGEDVTPLSDVFQYHVATATPKNWERFIIIKGVVASINLENPSYRGIQCILMDPELGFDAENQVKFYIPDHLRINFGQYSEVYVIGKTKGKMVEDENQKDEKGKAKKVLTEVDIDAWGIILIPGKTTEPQQKSLVEEEPEESIEGFIPI